MHPTAIWCRQVSAGVKSISPTRRKPVARRAWRLLSATALLLVSLALPWNASASTIYTARATFQAALSSFTTYDFESSGGSVTSFAAGEVTVGGTRGGNNGADVFASDFWQATAPTAQLQPAAITSYAGSRVLAADAAAPWRPLVLTFADAQHAIGFDDLDLTASGGVPTEVAVVLIFYDGGLPASQLTVSVTTNLAAAFFGIISTDPIRSVEIYGAEAGNLTYRGARSNLVDNVTLGTP